MKEPRIEHNWSIEKLPSAKSGNSLRKISRCFKRVSNSLQQKSTAVLTELYKRYRDFK